MPIIGVLNRELDEVGLTTLPRGVILSVPPEILLPGLHLYACVRVCPGCFDDDADVVAVDEFVAADRHPAADGKPVNIWINAQRVFLFHLDAVHLICIRPQR